MPIWGKEKGRQFGGLKSWVRGDPPREDNSEEHVRRFRVFDLNQIVVIGASQKQSHECWLSSDSDRNFGGGLWPLPFQTDRWLTTS
jgi:hypothetical protein